MSAINGVVADSRTTTTIYYQLFHMQISYQQLTPKTWHASCINKYHARN